MEDNTPARQDTVSRFLNNFFTFVDDLILVLVAIAIIALAGLLLYEAGTDFFYLSTHSIPHIISELMFVLIIMELFRQVLRQFNRHTFSLNPFIYIGFIASVRGLLLTQMGLAMGELEWMEGVIQLGVHAIIILILVACYYFYAKVGSK